MRKPSVSAPLAVVYFLAAAGSTATAQEATAGPLVVGRTTIPPLSLTRPPREREPSTLLLPSTSAPASHNTLPFTKPNCTFYFGSDVDDDSLQVTVVDPDVTAGYPLGDKTFMHRTGPGSACISPGPPAGCHRYFKVTYTGCEVIANGSLVDAAGHLDTSGLFDRDTGVLKSCVDSVAREEVFCYRAPADHPQPCECPGKTSTASAAAAAVTASPTNALTTPIVAAAPSRSPATLSASTVSRFSIPHSTQQLPRTTTTTIPTGITTTTTTTTVATAGSATLRSSTGTTVAIDTTTTTTTTTTSRGSTTSTTLAAPATGTTSIVDQPPSIVSSSSSSSSSSTVERTTTGQEASTTTEQQQLPCEPREDIFNLPMVTCTVTIDNALDGIWVDGEDILAYAADPACFAEWQTACVFTFFDRSFAGPQLLAFWGDERTFVGNAGEYCQQNGAGAALVCESTNEESEWNFVQTDFSWATFSSQQDVLTGQDPAWYSPSFDDSSWKPPAAAASGFSCDVCNNVARHSSGNRPVLQVWGAECADNAYFRKRVPMSCPGTEHTWPYVPPTTTTTTAAPSADDVTDTVVEADPEPTVVTDDVTCDDSEDADPEDACPDPFGIYIAGGTVAFAVVFALVVAIGYGQFVKKLRSAAAQDGAASSSSSSSATPSRALTALDAVIESSFSDDDPDQSATAPDSFLSI